MNSIITVTQLNRYISFKFKEDLMLKGRLIKGEISNFSRHMKTGHIYFTLKDSESSIKAIMFNNFASNVKFDIYDGLNVIVIANIQVYERDGLYQLYVTDIEPSGVGTLFLQTEQLKQKLSEEGLFDESRKMLLPKYPKKIGVITAKDGAALQDIISITERRYPPAEILLFPVFVQGLKASASIVNALRFVQTTDCDVIILGRGGGSYEDLMAFNSEDVVRAIASSAIPIISAVGHETDITLTDFAADLRAPTPSAAAELCVPDKEILFDVLQKYHDMMYNKLISVFNKKNDLVKNIESNLAALSYKNKIEIYEVLLLRNKERLFNTMSSYINLKQLKEDFLHEKLCDLNPEKIMERGFSLVYEGNRLIKSADDIKIGQTLRIKLKNGEITAVINNINGE